MNLDDLRLFAAVAELCSFSAAAERTGVPRSTLSRVVQRLEVDAGAPLLHRSTRRVSPTAAGAALLAEVQAPLAALREAAVSMRERSGEPAGLLRFTTTTDIATTLLAPVLTALTARHPRLRVEALLTLRPVDLIGEQVDVALRVYTAPPTDAALVGRRLRDLNFGWYAAPDYLRRRRAPASIEELAEHTLVSTPTFDRGARLVVDDPGFAGALVRAGAGVGLLPCEACAAEERSGALVRLMPERSVLRGQLWLVYPTGGLSPKVAAFRDLVVEQLCAD